MAAAKRVMCQACNGTGHSKETAPEMELEYNRELGAHVEVRTIRNGERGIWQRALRGSGCIRCLGVGYVTR